MNFTVSKNWENAFFSVIPKRKGVERLLNENDNIKIDEASEVITNKSNNTNIVIELNN